MTIYSMTATFGKLANETLTLEPGLNLLHAPNEWGKSTWCAFLIAMLYGLETRAKTTKTALADKERYAPWSGAAMAGRIDLNWNERDITIERETRGRIPMGKFRAYETETGLPIPELTAENCGQQLLGVERSVFQRAGFLRLSDLPLTQDEALRRRLNALVTTGDESSAGDMLAQKLKELKNKCYVNRMTGLIPQAQAQREDVEARLAELLSLQAQQQRTAQRLAELERHIDALENHRAALVYAAAQADRCRVAAAQAEAARLAQELEQQEQSCAALSDEQTLLQAAQRLQALQKRLDTAQLEQRLLPPPPPEPSVQPCFRGLDGQQATQQAQEHAAQYDALLTAPQKRFPLWLAALAIAVLGVVLFALRQTILGAAALCAAVAVLAAQLLCTRRAARVQADRLEKAQAICRFYGGGTPSDWLAAARAHAEAQEQYARALALDAQRRVQAHDTLDRLARDIDEETNGTPLPEALDALRAAQEKLARLRDLRREHRQAQEHAQALASMTQTVEAPTAVDELTCTEAETGALLYSARLEWKQLQTQLDHGRGRMESLGNEAALRAQLQALCTRIDRLRETMAALELAQDYLSRATQELQRRFAPGIVHEAQRILARLTDGRYDRVRISQELSVEAGTSDESLLRDARWRSEGTIDQLYLSLRLAVAEALTPNAPLILDDALVRFDDTRLAAAMQVLRELAQTRQILLFTCGTRELSCGTDS